MKKYVSLSVILLFVYSNTYSQSDYSKYMQIKKLFLQERYEEITNSDISISLNSEFLPYFNFYIGVSLFKVDYLNKSLNSFYELKKKHPNWPQIEEVNYWIIKILIETDNLNDALKVFSSISNIEIKKNLYKIIDPEISEILSFSDLENLYTKYPKNISISKYYGRELLNEFINEDVRNEINQILQIVDKNQLFISSEEKFKVAVLLPLMYESLENTYYIQNNKFIVDFYSGLLHGLHNLDSTNSLIEILPFDTKRNFDVVKKIIDSGYLNDVDLIIGPLYSKPISLIKQYCLENKLMMINPLSNNNEIIENNKYSLLFNPSIKTIANKVAEYSIERFKDNKNTILFYEKKYADSLIAKIYQDRLISEGFNVLYNQGVSLEDSRLILDSLTNSYEYILSDSLYDILKSIEGRFVKDGRGIDGVDTLYKYEEKFYIENDSIGHVFISSKNSLFASNAISAVDIRNDTIPIIGFDEWLDFDIITIDQFQNLDISLISSSYINFESDQFIELQDYYIKNYRNKISKNFILGSELINLIFSIVKDYGKYFQFGLRNEQFIPGNIFYGFKYLENNDNQIVPMLKVDSSRIEMVNQY
jgi:hypothetical protein